MTELMFRERFHPGFTIQTMEKINSIFSKSIMNNVVFSINGISVYKKKTQTKLRELILRTGKSNVEVICQNRVNEDTQTAKHTVRTVIHAMDYDENLWNIEIIIHAKIPLIFNNEQELTDICLYLVKGIIDCNPDIRKEFEIFPDVVLDVSYNHSGKKVFSSKILEWTKVFISESK